MLFLLDKHSTCPEIPERRCISLTLLGCLLNLAIGRGPNFFHRRKELGPLGPEPFRIESRTTSFVIPSRASCNLRAFTARPSESVAEKFAASSLFHQLFEATEKDVTLRREREREKKRKETKRKRRRTTRISLKLLRGLIRPIPLLTKTSVCPTLIDFFNPVSPWSIVILAIFSSLSLSLFLGSFPCPTFRLLRLRGTFARLLR